MMRPIRHHTPGKRKETLSVTAIGIFDSGIGGLSLVEACERVLPGRDILYVADTAHQPYGQKSAGQIIEYSRNICHFFALQKVSAVLAACSTASAVAVPFLQERLSLPIFGLLNDGWVAEALAATRRQRIGILATTLTTRTGMFARALQAKAGPGVQVFSQAAPELIDQISEGLVQDDLVIPALRRDLAALLEQGIDTLVVGCTHFNFILRQMQLVAGSDVQIINPRDWAVRKMAQSLGQAPAESLSHPRYYVTGEQESFQSLARKLWRPDAVFQPLELVGTAPSLAISLGGR